MMKLDFLLTTTYWFDPRPTIESKLYMPLAVLFALLIIAGIAILLFAKGDMRKMLFRFYPALLYPGILGFIYLFTRYEQLPYLAARFSLALIVSGCAVWILILLLWSARHIPNYLRTKETEDKFNKYLPKKKVTE